MKLNISIGYKYLRYLLRVKNNRTIILAKSFRNIYIYFILKLNNVNLFKYPQYSVINYLSHQIYNCQLTE